MSLFANTEGLKVVDMCKTFDEEFGMEGRDDFKLFRYLYLIIYAVTLREKRSWFPRYEDFDKYASYSARVLYTRFVKKQREGEKLDSVLNYFKAAMNGLKVNFQKEEFAEVISPEYDKFDSQRMLEDMQASISDDYFGDDKEYEITRMLSSVEKVAKRVVRETPYSPDEIMSHRLYVSVMLTFLSNLTINNKALAKFKKKVDKSCKDSDKMFFELLEREKQEKPILWRLPEDMGDYVKMLVNKMKHIIAKELRDISKYYVIPEDVVVGIMSSAYSEGYKNEMEEE